MCLEIQPSSAEPIYRQIVAQVRRQAASGRWPPGTPLPSVRTLALDHAINPMTVSKAYSLLEAEGVLERRRGMGMVIAHRQTVRHLADRMALLEPALQAAVQQAAQLGISAEEAMAAFGRMLAERAPRFPARPSPAAGPPSREPANPVRRGEPHAPR
jgi:GntR family transcriptional regulator